MSTYDLVSEEVRRGNNTPDLLKEAARDPEHPLHARVFDVPPEIASERYYTERARALLQITYRPLPGKPSDLRAFVAIKGEDAPRSEYVPTEDALANPFTRELLLRQMKRDWQTFKRRYDHMAEFAAYVAEQIGDVSA